MTDSHHGHLFGSSKMILGSQYLEGSVVLYIFLIWKAFLWFADTFTLTHPVYRVVVVTFATQMTNLINDQTFYKSHNWLKKHTASYVHNWRGICTHRKLDQDISTYVMFSRYVYLYRFLFSRYVYLFSRYVYLFSRYVYLYSRYVYLFSRYVYLYRCFMLRKHHTKTPTKSHTSQRQAKSNQFHETWTHWGTRQWLASVWCKGPVPLRPVRLVMQGHLIVMQQEQQGNTGKQQNHCLCPVRAHLQIGII
jgi:hypothetical protein